MCSIIILCMWANITTHKLKIYCSYLDLFSTFCISVCHVIRFRLFVLICEFPSHTNALSTCLYLEVSVIHAVNVQDLNNLRVSDEVYHFSRDTFHYSNSTVCSNDHDKLCR